MAEQNAIIESILHPTDFSEGSKVAFHHALKAALLAKSKLTLLNVTPDGTSEWSEFQENNLLMDDPRRWLQLSAASELRPSSSGLPPP